jgi:hypothetical protein
LPLGAQLAEATEKELTEKLIPQPPCLPPSRAKKAQDSFCTGGLLWVERRREGL